MGSADETSTPYEHWLGDGLSRLFVREVGHGVPMVVVHGGPDFDHRYLLPEMDLLAESFRLVCYDQRGRGRSFAGHGPGDVSMATELDDLDRIRDSLGMESIVVVGHSWGGLVAMEYAVRRPDRVSHLVLMNTAPMSHSGVVAVEAELSRRRSSEQSERMTALRSDPKYRSGNLDADVEFYRLHFSSALRNGDLLERVLQRLRQAFSEEGVVAARQIERRLYEETWDDEEYDLSPQLSRLGIPTLIIHGADDFVPIDVARQIADTIVRSQLVELEDCGHFSYLEQPHRVCASIAAFVGSR